MKMQAMILTCPERAGVLEETLARLAATDWEDAPRIQRDRSTSDDCRARLTGNAREALGWFSSQNDADHVLLLEDDLEFNAHLRWNLARWSPLVRGDLDFGSLYNPNIDRRTQGEDYFAANPDACYGSQAYILSRSAVNLVLREWESIIGMPDIKIPRILGGAGRPLFYHQPSLVQHIGVPSVWGGTSHFAIDFSSDWKHSFSPYHQSALG